MKDNLPDDHSANVAVKPANELFGIPIESITDSNLHSSPNIPLLIPTLTNALIKYGGCNTLGVFRISAAVEDLDHLKNQLESGDYDVDKVVKDPHLPAALLKQWLRSLPEPLIPLNSYGKCIEFAKQNSQASLNPDDFESSGLIQSVAEITNDFPPQHNDILIQLALLAKKNFPE